MWRLCAAPVLLVNEVFPNVAIFLKDYFAVSCRFLFGQSKQTGVHDAAEFALRHKLFEELLKKEEFMDAANCLGKLNLDVTSGKVCASALQLSSPWVID